MVNKHTNFENSNLSLEQENKYLKQQISYFNAILQDSNDAVIIQDFSGKIIAWDKGAESIFKWKQDELLSSSIFDIIPENKIDKFKKFLAEASLGLAPEIFETQKINKSGKTVDIWLTHRLLKGEGNSEPYGIATTERDVTERKRAAKKLKKIEEKYQNLVDSLGDGVFLINNNKKIILSNPAAEKIFFVKKHGLDNIDLSIYLDAENLSLLDSEIELLIKDGQQDFELEFNRNDGEKRLLEITITLNIDHVDNIDGVLCIFRDITEVRMMEEEVIKADKLESLGLLAGGIAHDFNNILSIITGNATLARMNIKDEEKLLLRLDRIEMGIERAKDLTNQISTLSKGGKPIKTMVNIHNLVQECAALSLESKKINYELHLKEGISGVQADEGQISQVINNLCINSSHAIDEKNGKIDILTDEIIFESNNKYSLDAGSYICINIKDNGCGISSDNIKRIFDPYFTTKSSGTGLGLSTSFSILKKHGGCIWVESEINVGTTFSIFIPTDKRTIKKEIKIENYGTVLFMDDEEGIRSIASIMLEKLNYKVILASNGEEAVEKYNIKYNSNEPFDAVLMDINVPEGMDGIEATKRILEVDKNAKIVAVSSDYRLSEYQNFGFIKAIKKPFRVSSIKAVLTEVVR